MRLSSLCLSLALGTTLIFVGCGGSGNAQSPLTPAKGVVTYNGKPLTKGDLNFRNESTDHEFTASIKPDGTWEPKSTPAGSGLPVGSYAVYVSGLTKSQIPVKFLSPSGSKTQVEIKPDQTEYNIDFK
jgi:hypothetical protein